MNSESRNSKVNHEYVHKGEQRASAQRGNEQPPAGPLRAGAPASPAPDRADPRAAQRAPQPSSDSTRLTGRDSGPKQASPPRGPRVAAQHMERRSRPSSSGTRSPTPTTLSVRLGPRGVCRRKPETTSTGEDAEQGAVCRVRGVSRHSRCGNEQGCSSEIKNRTAASPSNPASETDARK